MTVPGPGFSECGADNGASMALPLKFGVGDDIFEKAVAPSGRSRFGAVISMQLATIRASAADTKTCDAVVGQHFTPDLLGPLERLGTGADLRDPKEIQQ